MIIIHNQTYVLIANQFIKCFIRFDDFTTSPKNNKNDLRMHIVRGVSF